MTDSVDCVVIGAGAVGLAVAARLARDGREVIVLEAAGAIGTGTSSRNSEVIHAGIYYPTGSLKARLCVSGKALLYRYLEDRGIAHQRIGKLIVAVSDAENPVLEDYHRQAQANGVMDLTWVSAAEAAEMEPAVKCQRALFSPSTGILDTHAYMLSLQADLEAAAGVIAFNTAVERIESGASGYRVYCADGETIMARELVNSAGLNAPAIAAVTAGMPAAQLPRASYAKGHYYMLSGRSPFRRLVYPLAGGGGLGVHVTLDMAGAARFGPDVRWVDAVNYEFDDSQRDAFVTAIRRYYPELDAARLVQAYTGIRPKISGPGEAAADFMIQGPGTHGMPGLVNLFGIESPGITASLAIAEEVAGLLTHAAS